MQWSPDTFWHATPKDLFAAIAGYLEKNGQRSDGLNDEIVEELKTMLEE